MKTLLIIDANLGQARAYMAKTLLGVAARKKTGKDDRQSERRRNGDCSR
ncbi:hypothetical protein ACLBOM_14710 [Escherichia coli]